MSFCTVDGCINLYQGGLCIIMSAYLCLGTMEMGHMAKPIMATTDCTVWQLSTPMSTPININARYMPPRTHEQLEGLATQGPSRVRQVCLQPNSLDIT